jgi:hypothetical protein
MHWLLMGACTNDHPMIAPPGVTAYLNSYGSLVPYLFLLQ